MTDSTGLLTPENFEQRVMAAMAFAANKESKVWGLCVVPQTGTAIKYSALPPANLKTKDGIAKSVWAYAHVFALDAFGINGYSFGSAGTDMFEFNRFLLPAGAGALNAAVFDATNLITTGHFGEVTVKIPHATHAVEVTRGISLLPDSVATTTDDGLMSAADKAKLDGVATNANNYTLPTATATVKGGVELFSDTVQSVAAEAVTATAGRTYGIQLNSAGQAVVNVPWESSAGGGGGSDVNFTTAYETLLLNAVQDFVGRVDFDTAKEALLNNAVQAQPGYGLSQNDFTNYYVGELDTLIANSGGGDPAAAFQKDILIDTEGYVSEPGLDKRLRTYAKDVGGLTLPGVIAPYGVNFALQESLAFGGIAMWQAVGNATTTSLFGLAVTATGSATAANVALTNIHTATRRLEYAVTTASATAVAGLRQSTTQYALGNSANIYGGFHFVATFGPSRGVASGEARRFFAGMTSITAAPTDVQPSTWAANAIGVGADTGDVNWQIMHRAGTGAMTKIDTGFYKNDPDNSEMYTLSIFSPPQGGQRATVRFTRLSDGQFFERTITTNLPALTQLLAWQIWASVGGVSSVIGVSISSVYIKTKY